MALWGSKGTVSSVGAWLRENSDTNLIRKGENVTGRLAECSHGKQEVNPCGDNSKSKTATHFHSYRLPSHGLGGPWLQMTGALLENAKFCFSGLNLNVL